MCREVETFQVYPGIELTFSRVSADKYLIRHKPQASVMHINHCRQGRIGWKMKNGLTFYMGPGDLLLHMMDCCSDSEMSLPLGYYEGVSISVDLELMTAKPPEILQEAGIDGKQLYRKFFSDGKPVAMPASDKIEHIFSELYDLPKNVRIPYYKLKVQELMLFLSIMEISRENELNQHLSQQVEVIKEIHEQLTGDLRRRYTIEELAREYLINTSSLKTVFKAVYGLPVASYMKNYRLKEAARRLQSGNDSIAAIAGAVGYENQSKFTKAFKEMYRMLPTEYRKQFVFGSTSERTWESIPERTREWTPGETPDREGMKDEPDKI